MPTIWRLFGEDFTAQVVARAQKINERQLLRHLSQELGRRYRLVREQGKVRGGRQSLSRYRFAHVNPSLRITLAGVARRARCH